MCGRGNTSITRARGSVGGLNSGVGGIFNTTKVPRPREGDNQAGVFEKGTHTCRVQPVVHLEDKERIGESSSKWHTTPADLKRGSRFSARSTCLRAPDAEPD